MSRAAAIAHHPGEDLLWDYYRGTAAPGLALIVSAHLEACPHCRRELKVFDAVGGALLEDIAGIALSDSALDLALARIERPGAPESYEEAARLPAFLAGIDLPNVMRSVDIRNRYWAAPGVWMAPVRIDGAPAEELTYLMSVKAGMVMPEHTHKGNEVTMVLKGRFSDAFGEYGPSDFMLCDGQHRHSPTMGQEDCLCLVWQNAPIRPLTWLGKLLQPLARI